MASIKKTLGLLLLMGLFSCGKAPMFNHVDESQISGKVQSQNPEQGNCKDAQRSFPVLNLCYQIDWEKSISTLRDNIFTITFYENENDIDIAPLNFHSYLWMPEPHMNHGSAPFKIVQISPSQYRVSNVFFIMTGYWELHIQVKHQGQLIDEDIISIDL